MRRSKGRFAPFAPRLMSNVMPLKRLSARQLLVLAALCCVPVAAFALARPALTLATVGGLSCRAEFVCTDDPHRLAQAAALYDGAVEFLSSSVAPLAGKPLVVFCSKPSCYLFTGEAGSAAKTIGKFIVVISPRGWEPYFVRHELIHRLQSEKLGVIGMYRKPEWFIEGMAYSLSQDPRAQLLEPYQSDRAQFQAWYATVGKERMWSTALPE